MLCPMRRVLYGLAGGVLLALLKVVEYQYFVRAYPAEVYGGLVAVIFSALGLYFGLRWARTREVVVIREVHRGVEHERPTLRDADQITFMEIFPVGL
jgi:hypothetical protein